MSRAANPAWRPERDREHRKSRAQILRERTRGACGYCGTTIAPGEETRDHIVPRGRGGTTRTDNLMLCCFACNQAKADHDLETFRDRHFNGSAFWFELIRDGYV